MSDNVIGTVADIHSAFAEWARRDRAGELMTDEEVADLTTDEYGVEAGDYFIEILESLNE